MASKVDRIVARLQEKIAEGDYYEAQQQTRVAASRYIKTKNWPAAIDILNNVAQSLLKAGQGGSGGDLCLMMVDVYKQAELKPDSVSKGRLLTCLRLFAPEEPTRKSFIGEMMGYVAVTPSWVVTRPSLLLNRTCLPGGLRNSANTPRATQSYITLQDLSSRKSTSRTRRRST